MVQAFNFHISYYSWVDTELFRNYYCINKNTT